MACTVGFAVYFSQSIAQFGSGAFELTIHVSAQPVAPSFGMVDLTFTPCEMSVAGTSGQAAPMVTPPFVNAAISSLASTQYFLTSGRCCLSRVTAACNWSDVSSYTSLIPSEGCVLLR